MTSLKASDQMTSLKASDQSLAWILKSTLSLSTLVPMSHLDSTSVLPNSFTQLILPGGGILPRKGLWTILKLLR